MKVRCNRESLLNAWTVTGAVVPSKPIRPVLTNMKISAGENGLELFATDLDVGVRFSIPDAQVEQPGEVLVPASLMRSILSDAWGEEVEIVSEKDACEVILAESRFQLMGDSVSNYPEMPEFNTDNSFTLSKDAFKRMVELTRFAIAREDTRYALNGIYIELKKNTALMVATDGRRLSRVESKLAKSAKTPATAIVPAIGFDGVMKSFCDDDKEVVLSLSENMLHARTKNAIIFTKLIEGTFPNYEDVVPKNNDKNVVFNSGTFLSHLRQAAKLTSEESRSVVFSFEKDKLTLSSSNPEMGEATINMAVKYDGDQFEIRFNPAYLVDVLRALPDGEVSFEFSESTRPGIITTGKEFIYVVMPVNTN